MENVFPVLPCVADFEIKPLSVIIGVVVRLEHKFILVLVKLDGFLQIARLKP